MGERLKRRQLCIQHTNINRQRYDIRLLSALNKSLGVSRAVGYRPLFLRSTLLVSNARFACGLLAVSFADSGFSLPAPGVRRIERRLEAAPPALVVGRCGVMGGRLTTRARFMSPVWGVRFSESELGKMELRGVNRGRIGLGGLRRGCSGLGSLGLANIGLRGLGLGDLTAIGVGGNEDSGSGGGGGGGDEGGTSAGNSGYSVGNSVGKSTCLEGVASIPGGGVLLRPIGGREAVVILVMVVVVGGVEGEVVVCRERRDQRRLSRNRRAGL